MLISDKTAQVKAADWELELRGGSYWYCEH